MNTLLKTLWGIIIIAGAFIAYNFINPNTTHDIDPLTELPDGTNTEIIISEHPVNDEQTTPQGYNQYLKTAEAKLQSGYYELAIENFQKALSYSPNSQELLTKLANAYFINNQPTEARTYFQKASEISPDSIELKIQIARTYFNERNPSEAVAILNSLDQNNPTVAYYQAIALVINREFEKAAESFNTLKTLEATPEEIKEKSKRFSEAFTTYSYYKDSDQVFLETLLAKALADTKEYQSAIPLLFEIIDEQNNYQDAWLVLGYSYLNIGEIKSAIDALTKAKDLNPKKPETLFYLGLAHFANNEIDKAINFIEAADKNGFVPKEQIELKLGDLYLLKQDYATAADKYEKVISYNNSNIDIAVKSIWLNIDKLENYQTAIDLALTTIENHPNSPMSYNLAGWAYTANSEFETGEQYLKKALAMNPNFDAANLNFGWLHEKQGEEDLAKEFYKKAFVLGQGNSISNLAALRFNNITEAETQQFIQTNITAP